MAESAPYFLMRHQIHTPRSLDTTLPLVKRLVSSLGSAPNPSIVEEAPAQGLDSLESGPPRLQKVLTQTKLSVNDVCLESLCIN